VLLFRLDVWDARGATPWTNRTEYLFSVNTHTPPTMAVDSGEKFTIEVRGPFDDVEDIRAVPTPFTSACDGHPLAAPITGPIAVRGAKPGDVVAIDLSTSQRRLILASQPMVRRLSPGGSRIRTAGPSYEGGVGRSGQTRAAEAASKTLRKRFHRNPTPGRPSSLFISERRQGVVQDPAFRRPDPR